MDSLHDSILFGILLRLPLKSVITCKLVCKSWYHLISHPSFDRAYRSMEPFKRSLYVESTFDHLYLIEIGKQVVETSKLHLPTSKGQILGIVGSCDGLVCFLVRTQSPVHRFEVAVCIYNPLTSEYIELREPCVGVDLFPRLSFGFGCTKNTNQYKVFGFLPGVYRMLFEPSIQGQVFTVGVDSRWREYKDQSIKVDFTGCKYSVFFNGVLHWVGFELVLPAATVIYAFDLEEEKSVIIHLPPPLQAYGNPFLGILNDRLCAVGEEGCSCFWIMKDYGVVESWTKHIVVKDPIPQHSFLLYPGFVCTVASRAFAEEEEEEDSRKFSCDGEIEHTILGRQRHCQTLPYVPCFSSLKDVFRGGNLGMRKT